MATFYHQQGDPPGSSAAWTENLVLGTVNAPFRQSIDSDTLALCLRTGEVTPWVVHVATFLTEVRPRLVLRFAEEHDVSGEQLARAYRIVKGQTGLENATLEPLLVPLAFSA